MAHISRRQHRGDVPVSGWARPTPPHQAKAQVAVRGEDMRKFRDRPANLQVSGWQRRSVNPSGDPFAGSNPVPATDVMSQDIPDGRTQ